MTVSAYSYNAVALWLSRLVAGEKWCELKLCPSDQSAEPVIQSQFRATLTSLALTILHSTTLLNLSTPWAITMSVARTAFSLARRVPFQVPRVAPRPFTTIAARRT
jgi:hypothetical protein